MDQPIVFHNDTTLAETEKILRRNGFRIESIYMSPSGHTSVGITAKTPSWAEGSRYSGGGSSIAEALTDAFRRVFNGKVSVSLKE